MRAYIRVSGTYLPPNLPNRPNESGRCNRTDPLSSLERTEAAAAGSLVREQETEEDDEKEEEEWQDVNLRKFEGKCEEGHSSLGGKLEGLRWVLQLAELVREKAIDRIGI